jgi:hypothetical protein
VLDAPELLIILFTKMKATPLWPDTSEYPFHSRFFQVNGHRLHLIDEGKEIACYSSMEHSDFPPTNVRT